MNDVKNMRIMQKNRWDTSPLVLLLLFVFSFIDMLIPISVVLLLYEAHARQSEIQQLSSFFLFLRGLEDAGESLWYKICYIVLRLPVSRFSLKHVAKYSVF